MSRNRELSSFNSFTVGAGASYQFHIPHAPWISKSTANFRIDHFLFDYKDFRDALLIDPANGCRPRAPSRCTTVQINVMQLFLSVWY